MNTEIENKKISSINILKKINYHLDDKRRKEIKFLFFLSIFGSIAESVSIAMLIPFISFFINPDGYLFNNLFKNIFYFLEIENQNDILAIVSFSFIIIVFISFLVKIR